MMLIMKITKNNNLKNGITKHEYLKDINAKSKKVWKTAIWVVMRTDIWYTILLINKDIISENQKIKMH